MTVEPKFLVSVKDLIEFMFEIQGCKVKVRKPNKKEREFLKSKGENATYILVIEVGENEETA